MTSLSAASRLRLGLTSRLNDFPGESSSARRHTQMYGGDPTLPAGGLGRGKMMHILSPRLCAAFCARKFPASTFYTVYEHCVGKAIGDY
ncbi:Hypothetical protein SMAX5B_003412 [Scophthalmus maximus]|uniref:Uncharacterized protein n=1 Tax=Scophthalmus maximus TaxID=52904 RepID=A0A2U9CJS3_SCOMX|nr:Hypothetical protein SMAX5B_003412 [Scophthalmus maximus]